MSDNKKYFYMRLKEDFYDSPEMMLIESMPNGYKMSNLLMKMYCRCLRGNGRLAVNERIPYSPEMLSTVTRIDIKTVRTALEKFIELGLIEILDSGMIFMLDIQEYVGESSTEADRKRKYRAMINEESCKNGGHLSGQLSEEPPPYIETEKSTSNKNIEESTLNKPPKRTRFIPPTVDEVRAYCEENGYQIDAVYFVDYYTANGWMAGKNKMKDWKATVRNWNRREAERQAPAKPKHPPIPGVPTL